MTGRRQNYRRRRQPAGRTNAIRNNRPRGTSGVDNVVMTGGIKFMTSSTFKLMTDPTHGSALYGVYNCSFSTTTSSSFKDYMEQMQTLYRQYRISRVRVYASLGVNMDNDDRVKLMLFSRANILNTTISDTSLRDYYSLMSAPNTKVKTMVNRSSVKVADVLPVCMCNYGSAGFGQAANPILPSNLQWFQMAQSSQHYWKVGNFAHFLPEGDTDTKAVVYWVQISIKFRDRIVTPLAYSTATSLYDTPPIEPTDLTVTLEDLRTRMLTGAYFPTSASWPSIGNIGTSVGSEELIGCEFRDNADNTHYIIATGQELSVGCNII